MGGGGDRAASAGVFPGNGPRKPPGGGGGGSLSETNYGPARRTAKTAIFQNPRGGGGDGGGSHSKTGPGSPPPVGRGGALGRLTPFDAPLPLPQELLDCTPAKHGGFCSSVLDTNPRGVGGGGGSGRGGGVENFSPLWGHF